MVRSIAFVATFGLGLLAGTMIPPVTARRAIPPVTETAQAREPASRSTLRGAYAAAILRVIDGDTFEARVQVWPGLAVTTKVRLRGIDAPEINGRCAEERSRAESALAKLAAILAEPDLVVFRVGLDKYGGRVLADAATGHTPDVSQALLRAGLARSYDGGRRSPWCAS